MKSQTMGRLAITVYSIVALLTAWARISVTRLNIPGITMVRLISAGTSSSGADAHAPQPSNLLTYSSTTTNEASGSQHSQRKGREDVESLIAAAPAKHPADHRARQRDAHGRDQRFDERDRDSRPVGDPVEIESQR